MNILIVNGSPKGTNSITLQSMLYLEKTHTGEKFKYIHTHAGISMGEKDMESFRNELDEAELIIFSYPVYTFLVPYQLVRLIENLRKEGITLDGKWVTQFSTSKHFFDTTAHKYLEENLIDMNAKSIPGLSGDMEDLLTGKGRKELDDWAKMCFYRIENNIYEKREGITHQQTIPYTSSLPDTPKKEGKKISIVTNASEDDESLLGMIKDFQRTLDRESVVYNIRNYPFRSGCLGCLGCARTGKCIIKDNFDDFLREKVQNASAVVYAFRIENHYTHSSMKCFDDREFCNGHRSVTAGTPTVYILGGDIGKEDNLRTLIEGRCQVGGNNLLSIVSESSPNTRNDIENAAKLLSFALDEKIVQSKNFLGVGGMKIFRDLIFETGGLMRKNDEFYKRNGLYKDLPHKRWKRRVLMKLVGLLMALPDSPKKRKMMSDGMLAPYKHILEKIREK